MAQYPGAVKTFTSRNAGDVIQPSHVNDLQDEVNAIEAGLLQGTAPLNSSNSTVANLTVTGNTFWKTDYVFLSQTSTQTLSTGGAANSLTFQNEILNSGGMHSTSANTDRVTFPSTGVYLIQGVVNIPAASTGALAAYLVLNDVTPISALSVIQAQTMSGGFGGTVAPMALWRITNTTDYVTMQVTNNGASVIQSPLSTTVQGTTLLAVRVSR